MRRLWHARWESHASSVLRRSRLMWRAIAQTLPELRSKRGIGFQSMGRQGRSISVNATSSSTGRKRSWQKSSDGALSRLNTYDETMTPGSPANVALCPGPMHSTSSSSPVSSSSIARRIISSLTAVRSRHRSSGVLQNRPIGRFGRLWR